MINEYENTLRRIISLVLGTDDNSKFNVSPERLAKWKEKRITEEKKYDGILIEHRLIYYSDFYDLQTIITKNWEKFKDIIGDKKKFEVLFNQMDTFRNTIAHGRNLFSYQESLAVGIAGELRTSLVRYHNKNMNEDDYFIRLLKVCDNVGNVWERGAKGSHPIGMSGGMIRPGDKIEIIAEAVDPKGYQISYELSYIVKDRVKLVNEIGRFEFMVTEDMVKKVFRFDLMVFTRDSGYENSDHITMLYTVLP